MADLMPPKTAGGSRQSRQTKQQQQQQKPPKEHATAEAAASSLAWNGQLAEFYVYQDAAGRDVGLVARVQRGDDKQMPQARCDGATWFTGKGQSLPRPCPAYRLPELLAAHPDEPVLLPEGEKKVDLLHELGFVATCTAMGAGKAKHSDLTPLRGRDVVLLADNDDPGRNHVHDLAERLQAIGARSIRNAELPDLPIKGDVCDWYADRTVSGAADCQIADELRVIVEDAADYRDIDDSAENFEWESTDSSKTNAEVIDASVEAVINRFRQRGPMIHEPTGISGIDDRTGGGPVFGTRFYILGAPDAGKTLLLAQVADTYLQRRIAVGFLASDEDSEDVLQRFLQRRGVTRAECEGQDGPALENALRDVARLPLRIYPRSYTIEQAATDLMAFAEAKGMRAALMMDSLQTIRCNAEDPDASTYVNVTKRVESIREVGTQHKLIAMCTSEMSRGSYRSIRGADQSDMAAGKESGAIEYSARVMVALRSVPKESNMVELRFAKNKHGSTHREGEAGVFFKVHPAAQFLEEDLDYEPPTTTDSGSKQRIEKVIADVALIAVWLAENPGKGVREIEAGMKRVGWGKGRTETARTILTEDEALAVIPSSNNKKLHYLIGAALGDDVLELIPADKVAAVKASTPPVSECPGDTQEDTQESVLSGGVPSPPIGGGTPTTTAPVAEEHESEEGTQGHSVGSSKKPAPKKRSKSKKSAPASTIDDGLPEQQKPRRGRSAKTNTAASGGGAA